MNRILSRRSIIVLISDFQSSEYDKQLRITHRKHDLVNIHIQDPLEESLPDLGIIPYMDSESGNMVYLDTSSKEVQNAFRARKLKQNAAMKEMFTKLGIDSVRVDTTKSYIEPLMNFFKRRTTRY